MTKTKIKKNEHRYLRVTELDIQCRPTMALMIWPDEPETWANNAWDVHASFYAIPQDHVNISLIIANIDTPEWITLNLEHVPHLVRSLV